MIHSAPPRFHSFHYGLIYTRLCALAAPRPCITRTVADSEMALQRVRACVRAVSQLLAIVGTVKVDVPEGNLRCLMTQELHD